jgi:3-hydroxyisobutyrate dehydrogenase-like beta-hydroxyacid dehydrogenase
MAGHLANAGHTVTVYNRTAEKAQQWQDTYKGSTAATPADAAEDAEFIFTCVGNDDDLREVTIGDNGAFQSVKSGAVFIDHTTTSAIVA